MSDGSKKYVMAVIRMPIEILDVENGDYECIQDSASVTIEHCDHLPIVEEKDGYAGMADKIKELVDKKEEDKIPPSINMQNEISFLSPSNPDEQSNYQKTSNPLVVKKRKNITYRRFSLGHRHTVRKW